MLKGLTSLFSDKEFFTYKCISDIKKLCSNFSRFVKKLFPGFSFLKKFLLKILKLKGSVTIKGLCGSIFE
jgi:hypothetical protein